jgi:hypothetical protein
MRFVAIAAIVGLGMTALAGPAAARVWTDPNGRLTFDAPAGWTVEPQEAPDFTYAMAFNADRECHFVAMPSTGSSTASAARVRQAGAEEGRFPADAWIRVANGVPPVFPGDSAQFVSQSIETSQFWPIQRAELRNAERAVHSAIQIRPGLELWTFCMTFDGPDNVSNFDAVIRSVGTPNDAALQADAEANPVPPPPPVAPAPPPAN